MSTPADAASVHPDALARSLNREPQHHVKPANVPLRWKERPAIGRQRASLLLHELLAQHPDLLTPEQRHADELFAALEAVVTDGGGPDLPAAFAHGQAVLDRVRKAAGEDEPELDAWDL